MTCGELQDGSCLSSAPSTTELPPVAAKQQRLTRLVSEGALSTISESSEKCSPRYDSSCEDDEAKTHSLKRSESPMRCVSEFDEVTSPPKDVDDGQCSSNPLCNARLRSAHVRALRLEADLQPMRMILGRLMAHPLNKKGLFNAPVNALALGLIDYHQIIKKPMDLGTIKSRLYSIAYPSRQEVAEDICLVFENAMLYNPPKNPVHVAARSLQDYFEELYVAVGGDTDALPHSVARAPAPDSASRRVSFTQASMQGVPSATSRGKGAKGIMRTISCDIDAGADQQIPANATDSASPMEIIPSYDVGLAAETNESTESPMPEGSPLSATGGRSSFNSMTAPMEIKNEKKKRRLSYAGHTKKSQGHSCRSCLGRSCLLCQQSCLPLEPTLLVCNGSACAGAKIRKGSTYYIANDGSRQYCQRCFASLPPVLAPTAPKDATVRYKRDLLKRKNDEELVEDWLTCSKCEMGVHQICALHDSLVHPAEDYVCPGCTVPTSSAQTLRLSSARPRSEMYTFVTGAPNPLPVSEVSDGNTRLDHDTFAAEALAETDMSAFIETKVRDRIKNTSRVPNAEKTVTVRIVSDCERSFKVPDVVRKHFRMATQDDDAVVTPPEKVNFKSKAIALFQKVDGLDVCIFCMYVQEYEGNDDYGENHEDIPNKSKKRVYIAYLDSVEHFRPRSARTALYHELLVSYLASARLRGFESAHIWACPPSRGNSFVFWNHPSSQRTPTKDRLISWYHDALIRAIDCGVVTDVKSLYESDFRQHLKESDKENQENSHVSLDASGKMVCPPLLEGDYWIEEAVRIHSESLARHLKAKSANEGKILPEPPGIFSEGESCPARQVATLLLDRIMAHTSAAPFRKPVNAAALKLKDYHNIVTKPMDLGTIYSRCVHGEYLLLGDLVEDVKLVFSNAKKFNPVGHFVHSFAIEMEELFFKELEHVTNTWKRNSAGLGANHPTWEAFAEMSMSLDMRLKHEPSADRSTSEEGNGKGSEEPTPAASTSLNDVTSNPAKVKPPSVEDLLVGGSEVLSQRMAGEDQWMLEKKPQLPAKKPSTSSKKGNSKRRRSSTSITSLSEEEPVSKRRRQTWLGEEVGASVRSMRTSFFSCSLVPSASMSEKEQEKALAYSNYTKGYQESEDSANNSKVIASEIADARSALLEFSQRRHLEFDTLRHAKYSTAVLLYYLHNHDAPGVIPVCTSCKQETTECRWHKIAKVEELRKTTYKRRRPSMTAETEETADDKSKYQPEELCSDCHAKHPLKDQFIPLPVSFKSD